jgi:hypothetical protein
MACKYFYDNKEYTFDEFASLLENGLADDFLAKNLISSTGVYAKKAPIDNMPGAITINSSNANVNVGKGDNIVTTIVRQSQRMVKAMNKLSPNLSFTIHATEESWNQLREKMLADGTEITGMDGFYDPNTNQIHLNIPMMKKLDRFNTAFHEGYHPLTNALFNSRPDLRNAMHDQLVIMSNDTTLPQEFRDQVKESLAFGNSYDPKKYGEDSPLNEAIVEFLSRVSNGQIQIDGKNKTMMDHVRIFLNNLAGMFNIGVMMGNKEYTVDNLLDFARAMDFAIKQGVPVDFDPRNVQVSENAISDGITTKLSESTIYPSIPVAEVKEEYPLSFVKESDLIDIDSFIDQAKRQGKNIWFWVADQLGRGYYFDDVINGQHYLDAGPSFALDPENRDNNIIWASGMKENALNNKIKASDYIFIISGSPQKSKLFNKSVAEITLNRIKQATKGSYTTFKKKVNELSKVKALTEVVNKFNSFEELLASPERKEFLLQIDAQKSKNTDIKKYFEKNGLFVDYNDIRDGFYKENDFKMGDIMLVLQPTGVGGKSTHSTYENNVLGNVIGVPNKIVSAFDIVPSYLKEKLTGIATKDLQVIAPYGSGIKKLQPSLASEFVSKLKETKESDPKQYWSVDSVSLEDAKQGTVVKTEAGYGFVSQDGDIKGVFKSNKESAEKTGDEVLKKAVKAGGIKLDNFDGYLTTIYERNGFRIASRIPFNEEYAPEGWNKEDHGTPDVVAMVYDPYNQLGVEEKMFEDYMEGIEYRNSFVDLAYANAVTNKAMPPRIDARPNDLVSASSIVYDMTEDGNGNYVFYTDKVSGDNADVNERGLLELSTEKKTIQPSIVKVPFESTYPLDNNPLGIYGENEKEILQQAKNLGFSTVVNKDEKGNVIVMSDTVMPAKKLGETVYPNNKQKIQPSFGWAGSKGVQKVELGILAKEKKSPVTPIKANAKVVSEKQQSAFSNIFRTFFTVNQGSSQAAKSLKEQLVGTNSAIVERIDKDALEIKKLVDSFVKEESVKNNGLSKQTVYKFVNRAIIGEINPQTNKPYIDSLPDDLAEAVVQARQNIISLQETLVASGLLPAEIEAIIASTIGSYTKSSFYAFELKKNKGLFNIFSKQKKSPWFESVPEEVRAQARGVFQSWAMNGTLDNGFNILLSEYKKNFEDPYLALLDVDPLMESAATQQAAMAMKNELAKLQEKAGEFADAVMRKIEDVNQSGDISFSMGGSAISMKDYIEKNPALPKEIKAYLGEITDPAMNFRLTAMKLTRMLYNHKMVDQFKDLGLQTGDVVPPTEATPQGWIKLGEISNSESNIMKGTASDETDAINKYGSLKGCSVTPAMYDLLFDKPIESSLYYKFITSNVKKFKTLYSPSTQIKNLYGYTFFGMISGAIPEGVWYSPILASAAYKNINTPEGFMGYWNNMFNEAKRRGINTSLDLEEINRVGKELSQNKELLAELKGNNSPATAIYQTFSSIFSTAENISKKGMMYGDAIPKTIMFEVFRNANAAVLNGTSFYELDARQKEIANEIASRRVKLTTVTDTRTIKGIDYIQRRAGIFGSFPRFMSESIRNFVNAHMLVVNPSMLHEGIQLSENETLDAELREKMDAKTRASGSAGLAGYYSLMALIRAAMSFGDDDDEKVNVDDIPNGIGEAIQMLSKPKGTLTKGEALRKLLPDYDKFAALSYKIHSDGTVEYTNESSVDPFNIFPQAYRSFVYSENVGSGVFNAAKQVVMPVLGWEILFGTALEVVNNENAKGNEIYKNFDNLPNQVKDAMMYTLKKAGPGIITSSMRYKDLVKSGVKEGTALGVIEFATVEGVNGRISTTNIESKLKSKIKELNDSWIQDQKSYKSEFYRDKSPAERDMINKQRDQNAQMYAYQLNQLVQAGYALGLTVNQVKNVFKDAKVSKKVRKASMRGGSYIDRLNIDDIKED